MPMPAEMPKAKNIEYARITDHGGHTGEERDDDRNRHPHQQTGKTAAEREDARVDQELQHDAALARADGAADADLLRAFGDGGEHDVHDADTAHQQGNEYGFVPELSFWFIV